MTGVQADAHQSRSGAAAAMPVTRISATVPVAEELLVAVYTNASTGYHWDYKQVPGINISISDFPTRTSKPGQPPILGAPTIRVYHLRVLKVSSKPYVVRFYNMPPGSGQPAAGEVIATITPTS